MAFMKSLPRRLQPLYILHQGSIVPVWRQKQAHIEKGTSFLYDRESDLALWVDCCF